MNRHNRNIFSLATFAIAAWAMVASQPAVADGYTVTDLGALPGAPYSSAWQQTINNAGVVVGYANPTQDDIAFGTFFGDLAFMWQNGAVTPLPGLPNAIDTIPFSINNRGQAVGRSTPDGQRNHAVLWNHGVIQLLGELPGDNKSAALQINDVGQAVGYSQQPVADGNSRRGAYFYKGKVTQLTSLPGGGGFDEGLGINNAGVVVGLSGPGFGLEHAAVWDKSGVHDLGTLGGLSSDAVSINDKGQICGVSTLASGESAPFYWANGVMTNLGILPGDVSGFAQSINNLGQIVGVSGASGTGFGGSDIFHTHALLWQNGAIIDLQTKIPAGSGWTITQALGINDSGQIVGQGVFNGSLRAVLLTPVN